jgi:hypothetical protein
MSDQDVIRKRREEQLRAALALGDRAAVTMLRARIAADEPKYAASEDGQEALAQAAELAKIARRKAVAEHVRTHADDYPFTAARMSAVPYAGGENDGLDAGERAMLQYQRESR